MTRCGPEPFGDAARQDATMPGPLPAPPSSVYQLRVVLRGTSPIIWRRLLVRSGTTLAGLRDVVQAAFVWDYVQVHRFKVHRRELASGSGCVPGPSTTTCR
jgi:hypothetical protein